MKPTKMALYVRRTLAVIAVLGCWARNASAADSDQARVADYTKFWRTALASASGISEAVLAPLIQVEETEISTWNSGKTFRVRYAVKLDWLTVTREDQFMVWINESESAYRQHGLPRDTWLTGAHLNTVIARKLFETTLGRVDPTIKPAFTSLDEAKAFVRKEHKLTALERAEITFYVPGKVPREDGLPYPVWSAVLDEKANKALNGYLNLVTKDGKSWENAIRFYGVPPRGVSPEKN
ncbi:MAG: hypothetical protein ABIZ81_11275 [Opitutaceae bacterium]